ncbi:MAG: 4-hydroxy-tetrahydrodipicolinate reductase [Candidatus Caenarcaniphilales bacterium]|nr:4-hydroxy-tetrahydrodipicolinate reductase [Candidatus Caenarcaniphilales bacterium]
MSIKVIVTGAAGRMGQETIRTILNEDDINLVSAIGRSKSDSIGRDIGELVGYGKANVNLTDNLKEALQRTKPDVMVDFTVPDAVYANACLAIECGISPIIGATGLSSQDIEDLDKKAKFAGCSVLVAPNFAIGALLLIHTAKKAANYFDNVEIIELHHDKKVDAPSGTAIKTAKELAKIKKFNQEEFSTNSPARGENMDSIRVHSVRLPGLVAHQEVIFGGIGQTLSIKHDTINREAFMPGVVIAIKEIGKHKGLIYGLENLLDL